MHRHGRVFLLKKLFILQAIGVKEKFGEIIISDSVSGGGGGGGGWKWERGFILILENEYSQEVITRIVATRMCVSDCVRTYMCVSHGEIQIEAKEHENVQTLINLFNFACGGLTTLSSLTAACSINGSVNSKY